jgi:hypothetical protein
MNFGFTPLRTADSTAFFLVSWFEGLAVASHPLQPDTESAFLLQKNLHVLKVKGHRPFLS